MARLPQPGSDDGTWGDILNDYLVQAHNADGTLKANVVSNTNIVDGTIQSPKLAQTYIQSSEKGSANGVASLDATAKVPASQLPAATDPPMGGDLTGTASNAQIATGAVGTSEIADLSVSLAKLAATVAQSLSPAGAITPFAGSVTPDGWFACDGTAVSRTTYGALFTAIGTAYGAGDGSTTFNLPNLRGRVPVGVDGTQTEFDTRGETGGAKTHTLIMGEMPSHTHVQDAHNHTQNAHNHVQDAHNHTQNSHNHTQNSHNHTQNSHSHGGITGNDSPDHGHNTSVGWHEGWNTHDWGITNGGDRTFAVNNTVPSGGASARHQHSVAAEAAVNQAATATNIAATATNIAATATNQSATATNIAATATNQSTGGGGAHNNLQPYIALNYIIKY